ncbi:hypothetical protein EVA_07391 [gut metagenome]|uniref:Uncharacterized protein n=1 Tax=gut metagenome TaxID=749906 RepID=J9GVD8_9ZZZZ
MSSIQIEFVVVEYALDVFQALAMRSGSIDRLVVLYHFNVTFT